LLKKIWVTSLITSLGNKESTRNSKLSLHKWTRRCTITMASGSTTQTWLTILKHNKWKEEPNQWQEHLGSKKSQLLQHKCLSNSRQKMTKVNSPMPPRANFCITGNLELQLDQRLAVNMVVPQDSTSRNPTVDHMLTVKIKKVDWVKLASKDLMKNYHRPNLKEDLVHWLNRALDQISKAKSAQRLHHLFPKILQSVAYLIDQPPWPNNN